MPIFLYSLLVVLFDQISKIFIIQSFSPGQSLPVIKNIFHLTLIFNTGAAFGIFKNQTIFFIIVSFISIFFILACIFYPIKLIFIEKLSLGLILGGAIGNLIDRLRFGYVIDFLDFRFWPVFNLADSAISIGCLLLIYVFFRRPKQN